MSERFGIRKARLRAIGGDSATNIQNIIVVLGQTENFTKRR